MADVSDLPIVGRILASGGLLLDWLLSGGDLVLELGAIAVSTLLGHPEILVGALTTLRRLGGHLPFVPMDLVDDLLTVALVAMFALYVLRYLELISDKA